METPYGEIPDSYVPDMTPQDMHDYLKKRYSRRTIFKGAAVLGAASTPLFWQQASASAATATTGPQWISYGADPSSQMFISWSAGTAAGAAPAVPSPQVRWGTDATYGSTQAAASTTVPIPAGHSQPTGDIDNTVYIHTELSGLTPGTTYHYAVSYDGINWGPDTTFTTAPAAPKNFRWVGTGDEATSSTSTTPVAQLIKNYNPDFTVVAGDLSYASGGVLLPASGAQPSYSPGAWDDYFNIIGPNVAQSTPWIIGVGNHEMEPLDNHGYAGVLARFPQPWDTTSGSPVTQAFTHGNVAFIGLDGNDLSAEITPNNGYTAGQQTTWLTNKLAAYRAAGSGIDFIVVYFHNCMYCSNQTHGSDDGVRHVWAPLFDQYQVDLVVNGHVHAYERSNPVRGTTVKNAPSGSTVFPATDGTTYICAGGGGQSLYTTWYGTTLGGDTGTATTTAPKIYQFGTSETASGGTGTVSRPADTVTGFSAFRKAVFSFIVVDVVAPTTTGGVTTMHVQALNPTGTSTGTMIDDVTLSRTSTVVTAPSLPEVAKPALLVAGAGAALAGGVYAASRRDRLSGPSA